MQSLPLFSQLVNSKVRRIIGQNIPASVARTSSPEVYYNHGLRHTAAAAPNADAASSCGRHLFSVAEF